ncbi:unnamed protein product [Arctogadus glacialis]
MTAQTVLELAIRSLKFLAREGLPLRGQEHRDGVFWQLMLERTHDKPAAHEWLLRRNNWMPDSIQNKLLECVIARVSRGYGPLLQTLDALQEDRSVLCETRSTNGLNNKKSKNWRPFLCQLFLFQLHLLSQLFLFQLHLLSQLFLSLLFLFSLLVHPLALLSLLLLVPVHCWGRN